MTTKKSDDRTDLGKSFEELEGIIEWFESGEADLDEGIRKFERGLELAKACKLRLKEVENKVNEIKVKFGELGE